MNIIIINLYAGAKKYGMEYRPYFLGREWVKKHNVYIFCSSFSHTRFIQPEVKKDFDHELIENINYYYLKGISYSSIGFRRLINNFSFFYKLYKYRSKIIKLKPDVIIASSTYPLDVFPAYSAAKKTGAKLVTEYPDLMPLTLTDVVGLSRWHPLTLLVLLAEKFSYRKSDKVVCVLPKSYEYMKDRGLKKEKFLYIPNGVAIGDLLNVTDIPGSLKELINNLRGKGKFLVGYSGYHGIQNNLSTLIYTAEKLRAENIAFILVGNGPEKNKIVKLSQSLRLENTFFHDAIDKSAVTVFLKKMDILFMAFSKRSIYMYGVNTNKLYDYMISEVPVVQVQTAGNDLVKDSGCGISVEAENFTEAASAVLKIKNMTEDEKKQMGRGGKEYVIKNNTYSYLAEKYLEGTFT